MKLYLNTSGQWIFDGGAIPAGSCRYTSTRSGVLTISLLNGFALYKGNLTDLQREDGTTYSDEAEFLLECGDFFVNPLNPLKEDVEGLQEDVTSLQEGKADLVEGKVPDEQLPETTFPTIAVENMERTIAESLLILQSRIQALEGLLVAGVYGSVQAETISAVSSLQFKGAELILQGAGAPTLVPDFIGQIYVKTDATVAVYIATGIATSGDWKSV
jgi:hypothetical protein